MAGHSSTLHDLLRLSADEIAAILEHLDGETRDPETIDRRRSPRVPYRVGRVVVSVADIMQGSDHHYSMVPRDISAKGMGLLHGQFVYPGSTCVIYLTMPGGGCAALRGRITRCRHISGRVHELGVEFDDDVNLKSLLSDLSESP